MTYWYALQRASAVTNPTDMSQSTKKHGCYFKDGERKADYVIVVNEDTNLPPLNPYIRSLEQKGLQFEKAVGLTVTKIFFLIHIPKKALQFYSRMYDVGLDEKKVIIADEHISPCFRSFSTPISEIPDKEKGEFTSAERIMIIHKLLESTKYGDGDTEYGIYKMIKLKMVHDAYPLHDGPKKYDSSISIDSANDRQLLYCYWANFTVWYKEIPLDMIQKYFGCEIAFYFAWLQYFNYMLFPVAILGVIVVLCNLLVITNVELNQINEVCDQDNMYVCSTCEFYEHCIFKKLSSHCSFTKWTYVFDNYLTIAFAVLLSFWATLFVNLWRRKENELKLKWNVQFKDIGTEPRQSYRDSAKGKQYNELSGKMEPVVHWYSTFGRMMFVLIVCMLMVLMVLSACIAVITYKIHLKSIMIVSGLGYLQKHAIIISLTTGSFVKVVFIKIFGAFYGRLSIWLTDIENPRTQYDYDVSVLHKRYLLSFTNSYIPLFYSAFVKGKLYTVPHNHKLVASTLPTYFQWDTCQPSTCILSLCITLAFILIFKKFVGNIVGLLILKFKQNFSKSFIKAEEDVQKLPRYEREYKLKPTNRYLFTSEYCDVVINYGLLTYFVAAFPLAPFCALLHHVSDSRIDAYKLLTAYRRPVPRKVPGIGSWNGILVAVTYLSYATNAIVIAFTSDFVGREIYRIKNNAQMKGYVNSTLSEYAVTDYQGFDDVLPNTNICYYRGMRYPPNHPKKYELTGYYWTEITWKLVTILVFEHVIFLCNGILGYAIPNLSASVKQQLDMDRLLAREAKIRLLNDDLRTKFRPFR